MRSLSILVADDEESMRAVLRQLLTKAGHDVVTVGNAREAGEPLRQRTFDLVITDVLMPEGDGVDLIAEVKKQQPRARIVAISGGGRYLESGDYLKLATGLGAHSALNKPFNGEQLQAAMAKALEQDHA